jgi:1,4-dihydroxy-2-naphthoate octaprenyltransferase
LAARGLGELDTTLVVAILVPSVGYAAQTDAIDGRILSALVAPAAAMFAMMLGVELPDAGADLVAGKRTLVVRWGPSRAWTVIAAAAACAAIFAVSEAAKVAGTAGVLALAPAGAAALVLARAALTDPRPATIAFWGVALYATTAAGLAGAYALAAAR